MSRIVPLTTRIRAAVKGWLEGSAAPWYLGDTGWGVRYQTGIDYASAAGPADANAIVMACINWVTTTFPEAPIRVQRRTGQQTATVPDHPLTALLETPNAYYTGLDLWAATLADYNIGGNAFWIAPRNARGRPVELWYEPSFSIRAVGSASEFIAGWEVYRGAAWVRLDPRENLVIHFRRGIDPRYPRYGLSPLRAAYREIYTDNEAAAWSATLLRNTGIPGVIIAPKGSDVIANPEAVKQAYQGKFTGDRRGEPMVMTKATDVYKLDWSPAEMDLTALRRLPEERIAALLGVPAIVAGLGAGLDRSTYENYDAARSQGWEDNISPTQMRVAATLQARLLPLLGNPATERVSFDTSQVKALQEDATALYGRMAVGYTAGFLKRSEARQATGWPPAPDGSDDVYKAEAAAPPLLPAPNPAKARRAAQTKAAPRPAATERRFRADVAGVLTTLYREALAEASDGQALAAHRNGHSDE